MKSLLIIILTLLAIGTTKLQSQNCCNNLKFEFEPELVIFGIDTTFYMRVSISLKETLSCIYNDTLNFTINKYENGSKTQLSQRNIKLSSIIGKEFKRFSNMSRGKQGIGKFEYLFTGISEDTCKYEFEFRDEDYYPTSVDYQDYKLNNSFVVNEYFDLTPYLTAKNIFLVDNMGKHEKIETTNTRIDFSRKTKGLYFLIIESESSQQLLKILKI